MGRIDLNVYEAINSDLFDADMVLICSHELHCLYRQLLPFAEVPIIHIGMFTGKYLQERALTKVLLLGTQRTMEDNFYSSPLAAGYHLDVSLPKPEEQKEVNRIISEELCCGLIKEESQTYLYNVIYRAKLADVQAVVLAGTELSLIISEENMPDWVKLPIADTLKIHAEAAVKATLEI